MGTRSGGRVMTEERLAELIMNWYENISDESLELVDELLEGAE